MPNQYILYDQQFNFCEQMVPCGGPLSEIHCSYKQVRVLLGLHMGFCLKYQHATISLDLGFKTTHQSFPMFYL